MSRIFVNKCPYIYTYMHTYIHTLLSQTTLAHTVARHCGYRVLEVNASDDRSPQALREIISSACLCHTIDGAFAEGTEQDMYVLYVWICICMWAEKSSTSGSGKGSQPRPNCIILDEVDGISEGGKVSTTTIHKKHTYIYVNWVAVVVLLPVMYVCMYVFVGSAGCNYSNCQGAVTIRLGCKHSLL